MLCSPPFASSPEGFWLNFCVSTSCVLYTAIMIQDYDFSNHLFNGTDTARAHTNINIFFRIKAKHSILWREKDNFMIENVWSHQEMIRMRDEAWKPIQHIIKCMSVAYTHKTRYVLGYERHTRSRVNMMKYLSESISCLAIRAHFLCYMNTSCLFSSLFSSQVNGASSSAPGSESSPEYAEI